MDEWYLRKLSTLTPSSALRVTYAIFLATAKTALREVRAGDLGTAEQIFLKARPLATKLGARACRMWDLNPHFQ